MGTHTPSLKFIAPMECTAVPELPDDCARWIYEVKLDGYRCCAVVHGDGKAAIDSHASFRRLISD